MKQEPTEQDLENTKKYYSEAGFSDKLNSFAKKAGVNVIYRCLLLYQALTYSKTPTEYRAGIIGALGYFISPLDFVPDVIPVVGFSDDLVALMIVINLLNSKNCLDSETRKKAKVQMKGFFKDLTEQKLENLDNFKKE